jgi:hypothetical protein
MNFHMNSMEKTSSELHGILKIADENIKKNSNHVMMVQKENKKRKRWMPPKGKGKEHVISDEPPGSKPKPKGKYGPSNDACFHCHKKRHWYRKCKKYLEEHKKKGNETSTSGINVV